MSETDRYNELISSAFETAYADEMEKLGYGAAVARGLSYAPRAGKWLLGALGRTGARQRHALGLGVKGAKKGTPEYAARLKELKIPGAAAPRTAEQILAEPMMKVKGMTLLQSKPIEKARTGVVSRIRRAVTGTTVEQEAKRIAGRMAKEEAGARKMFKLTGGTIPGTAKAMATHPLQTLGAGYKSMRPFEKTMFGGFGAMTAHDLAQMQGMTPEEKAEAVTRAAAGMALWPAAGGLTFLPQMGVWMGGEEAAAQAAKAIARKASGGPPPPPEGQYQLTPEEIATIREGTA